MRERIEQASQWLNDSGPLSEVVISSRVRLARNLAGFPFVARAAGRQRQEVLARVQEQLCTEDEEVIWVNLSESSELDRQLLVERHLISRQHARVDDQGGRAVAIGTDETFAIMVNEEDHLRIQVLRAGMQLSAAYEQINRIDNQLEEHLDFAFSRRFGYLTACPTNVGTGIRISVMLHLPALKLTGEIEKVRRAARDMHLAVRGLFGEGSDVQGDLYQISNQTTLGRTEQELLADFEHTIVPQIVAYEKQARETLLRQKSSQLDDRIWRAWGLLTHARLLGTEEVMDLLSHLHLGVHLGRLTQVDRQTLSELFLLIQPAHLQKLAGMALDVGRRREVRAEVVRQRLAGT